MNVFKNTQVLLYGGIALLVVLAGVLFFVMRHYSTPQIKNTTMATETTSAWSGPNPTASAGNDSINVADQSAGTSASIATVTLSKDGWVAVNDEKGWTLGAAWFPAGTHTDVSVHLLRATKAGEKYGVMLYFDTKGDHTFSVRDETVVTDKNGAPVSSSFTAQ